MAKLRKLSKGMSERLRLGVLSSRKDTIYKMISKKNDGVVPCFVCGKHVLHKYSSLEHILPRSKGGTDEMSNLTISHQRCNQERGDREDIGTATVHLGVLHRNVRPEPGRDSTSSEDAMRRAWEFFAPE